MDRKKAKIILGVAAIAAFVISVTLLCVTLFAGMNAPSTVIMGIVSFFAFALSIELGYFFLLNKDANPNYFLYDPASKKNVPVQKLNFGVVNGRMSRYLSEFAPSEGKIWNERVLDNVDIDSQFKPLVAYKLLYSLAEKDVEGGWNCLENASSKTIVFICEALSANSDYEFSNTFGKMMAEKPLNMPMIRDYLIRNKKYMQNRMFRYVVDNIDQF